MNDLIGTFQMLTNAVEGQSIETEFWKKYKNSNNNFVEFGRIYPDNVSIMSGGSLNWYLA